MTKQLRSIAARLRKRFPGIRVTTRRAKLKESIAETTVDADKKTFVITLEKDIDETFAVFVFVHEFAHAVSFHVDGDNEHGPAFWKAYRTCFEIYCSWCRE
jgi:hypothetical protein